MKCGFGEPVSDRGNQLTSQFLRDNLCMSPLEIRVIVTQSISGSAVLFGYGRNRFGSWSIHFQGDLGSVSNRVLVIGEQDQCGQATKGVWGMSWRQEAKKGVEDCDKPGGMVKRVLIPGYPNQRPVNP